MGKKSKNPQKNGNAEAVSEANEGSSSSTIFNTLFGEIQEENPASNSLFSDNNPFRRKLLETQLQNQESKPAEDEGQKRKKDKLQSSNFDELVEEKSKKSKRADLRGNKNDGVESKEAPEVDTGHYPEISQDTDFSDRSEKKKKKKRKRDEVEAEYEAKLYGVTDEQVENKGQSNVLGEKRKKMDNPEDTMVSKEGFDDESKLLRTIFVGNLPLKLKKKEILKEFEKFGEVESVRIRSVPIIDGKIPRKGAIIKKQFNENGDSVHAYIVFKTEEAAQASLVHNMAVVGGNHVRVDRACPPRKKLKEDNSTLYDNKRTVFVGNLPFDVKDEEIYKLFCGIKSLETSVEAVRVIRDPGSSQGKGIAYVLFKTTGAASSIVKKRLKLRDRELRLSHAKSTDTPLKRKNSSQPETNDSHSAKKPSIASRTPDNGNGFKAKADLSYQGIRASQSGASKKVHTRISRTPVKSKSDSAPEHKSRMNKRPAVAARKEKALRAANASKVAGSKRKLGNRTPGSSGQKKKARKFK